MIQFLNAAPGTATTAEMLMSFLPMILIIVFMIVLIYLPQKRQDKKDAAMRSSIEIGDKVSTIGRQGRHPRYRDRQRPHQDPLPPLCNFFCGEAGHR